MKLLLTTVPNVTHQEPVLQIVHAQMDSMIMETLVLVVPTTVLLVTTEKNVPLVMTSEKTHQLVNVQLDTMILVKLNVNYVELNVKPVIETMSVPLAKTHL